MEKSKNIFIKVDEFIFQKLDLLRIEGSFQKMNELISALDEKQQKIFAQIITFTLLIVPFLVVIFLWWGNHFAKNRIEVKSQILEQISLLNNSRDSLMQVSSIYLAPVAITGQEDLDNKIRNLMSTSGVEQSKVSVKSFNQISSTSTISKVEAVLTFKDFGTSDFSNFMHSLVEREKFKVMKLNLTKNKTTALLSGEVSLIHLGKNSTY